MLIWADIYQWADELREELMAERDRLFREPSPSVADAARNAANLQTLAVLLAALAGVARAAETDEKNKRRFTR